MAGNSKKAAPKAAAKKTAQKKTSAQGKPRAAKKPKPGPRCIRNLLGVQQNLRLRGDREKPYAVTLRPRGQRGDAVWVPLACQDDTAFMAGLDRQFEIITEAEFKKLQTEYPPIGYTGRMPHMPNLKDGTEEPVNVRVVVPEKTIVQRIQDPYAKTAEQGENRTTRTQNVGPQVVNMPGSVMGQVPEGGGDNAAIMADIEAQMANRKPAPKGKR